MRKQILAMVIACVGMISLTPFIAKEHELNREVDLSHLQTVLADTPTVVYDINKTLNMARNERQTVAISNEVNEFPTESEYRLGYGEFELTFYCCCEKCCGKDETHPAYGITASGEKAVEGITVAADPSVFPLGSKLEIEGFGTYIVQDTGKSIKGNKIDIFLDSHERCLEMGVKRAEVTLVVGWEDIDFD